MLRRPESDAAYRPMWPSCGLLERAEAATLLAMMQLYTFPFSHFSEKARWGLDLEELSYRERPLMPGLHIPKVKRMARRSSVPVLEHDGEIVQGSGHILDYMERLGHTRVAPRDAAARERSRALEEQVDHAFGFGIQCIFYAALLSDRERFLEVWTRDAPFWAPAFYTLVFPRLAKAISRMYRTDPESVAKAKDRFREAFDTIDRILEQQPYLGGDAPDRSDITVAALLSPSCRPPEHVFGWPEPPPELEEFLKPLRGRPTWQHVLKMYREHRRG